MAVEGVTNSFRTDQWKTMNDLKMSDAELSRTREFADFENAALKRKKQGSKSTLTQDDFLKLFISGLQHQDPMSPVSDKEFIAQMASFSSIKEMNLLRTEFSALRKSFSLSSMTGLIGKKAVFSSGAHLEIKGVRQDENGNVFVITDEGSFSENEIRELRSGS